MIVLSAALAAALGPAPASAAAPALERAMRAELSRARVELKEDGYPGVYYAALNVWDVDEWGRWSEMGAARAETRSSQRVALADVRGGSPALDNHPDAPRPDYLGVLLAGVDDEFVLRHELWRVFDGAYKTAAADYLRHRERIVARGRADYDADDLAPEPPAVSSAARPASRWDLGRLRALQDALSRPLRGDPTLLAAESHASLRRAWERRRDSDGAAVDREDDAARLTIVAAALAPDGLRETVAREWSARSPEDLPDAARLARAGRELLDDLRELRASPSTSPFSAPALLDPSVAAALTFSLALRLSGELLRDPNGARLFGGRVGERLLSPELTLVDDPARASLRGRPLFGRYAFDDQGVPARRVVLVERGVLKGFLLSRYPVNGFPRSNGHARARAGHMPAAAPGNLFLGGADPRPVPELLARLRGECRRRGKPYGLWVRRLRAAVQNDGAAGQGSIRLIARVDLVPADGGPPRRVRDLDVVGTPLVLAGSVLAVGDDPDVSDLDVAAPASVVAPSLLLSDVELQRSQTKPENAPVLPPPAAPAPPRAGARPSRRVPFVPRVAYVEVDRYVLAGRREPLKDLDVPGVREWRQRVGPEGLTLEVKVVGDDLAAAGAAVRRAEAAVRSLAGGGVSKSVLSPTTTLGSYRALYGDGWPAPR